MREPYDESRNVVWQTRAADPTDYETAVGDALETIFGDGVYDLPGIVERLNALGLTTENGESWTEETFKTAMQRLGRKEFG